MKFKYSLNTEISKGFSCVKNYLVDSDNFNKEGLSFLGDSYICLCINQAVKERDIKASTGEGMKRIINSRLGLRKDSAFYHDIESYLQDKVKVRPKLLTRTHVQLFRHRWLDALVSEFNVDGICKA